VRFTFPVTADELGFYNVSPEVRAWLKETSTHKIASLGKMTTDPIEPGGLPKRARRPTAAPIDAAANGELNEPV
jgi:hypothetical protein